MNKDKFKTTDLGEASTLLALGFRLSSIEDSENRPGQKVFIFSDAQLAPEWWIEQGGVEESAEEIIDKYRNGIILVNAQDYFLAIKHLKSRIFSQKNINN